MKKKIDKDNVLTALICVFIGVAIAMIIVILIELHQPAKVVKNCNDGWSTQYEGDKIYKTYIPENDTCTKEK